MAERRWKHIQIRRDEEPFPAHPRYAASELARRHSQTTVDGRIRYSGKENLYEKLHGIIKDEREGCTNFCINTLSDRSHDGTQENIDHIAVGKSIQGIVKRVHERYGCTAVFWHAYSNADKVTNPVVHRYTNYPVNVASHDYFDLLVWKAMALGAYSAKIQECFPSENGVHLYLSESENAESVQWLSHMCIDYVFPGNRTIDHFYKGCIVKT